MRFFTLFAALAALTLAAVTPARADDRADALAVVARSTATVGNLQSDEHFPEYWQPSLARARAVLIIPSFYKAGFFVGGAYGNGLLTVRDNTGTFSPPAFYRMTAGSLGIQFGAEEREIMYMIMTDNGLNAILEDRFKVGAGLNLAIATWGGGAEAATTSAAGADIVAFSHAAGAFGGGAIEGAGIEPRIEWNRAVYGPNATSKSILFDRRYTLDQAQPLINALNAASNFHPNGSATPQAPQSQNAPIQSSAPQTTSTSAPPPMTPAPASSSGSIKSSLEVQSLDAPTPSTPSGVPSSSTSVKSSTTTSSSSSGSSAPVRLVPQQGNNLQ